MTQSNWDNDTCCISFCQERNCSLENRAGEQDGPAPLRQRPGAGFFPLIAFRMSKKPATSKLTSERHSFILLFIEKARLQPWTVRNADSITLPA